MADIGNMEMRLVSKVGLVTALAVFGASPALAGAIPPAEHGPGGANKPSDTPGGPDNPGANRPETPGPDASLPKKAKAYGRYCKDQSKKHVAGEKGTPFSRCVTAMAKLASEDTSSPRKACKGQSKKHVDGEKGTPFSRCVSAGAKLLKDQKDDADA
jgi:hypothetical protein